jgi:YidC/Oxa1 family membrane protein insertase
MAETGNGGTKSSGQGPKEMSMETRLLLAFLLMGAVMFLTPYFFPSATTPAKKSTAPTAQTAQGTPPAAAPAETTAPTQIVHEEESTPTAPVTHAKVEPSFSIDTDLFHVTFSNQGGNVRSWVMKKYTAEGKPLDLVNPNAAVDDPFPFSIYLPDDKALDKKLNWSYYSQTLEDDGLGVTYEFSDGHNTVRKTFRFLKNSYLAQISSELTTDGKPVAHMLEWRCGFGDLTVPTAASAEKTLYYDLANNKLMERTASNAKNGPLTDSGHFSFAGLEDAYFTAVVLPEGEANVQQVTFADTMQVAGKPVTYIGGAVSGGSVNHFEMFVGPKDYDLLKRVNPKLEQLINFGWLSILAKPLFLIVNWSNDHVVHNFGWAIVVVTIVINFMLFPVKLSNMKSMRKMQALKPQIDAINAKYKGIKISDPKKGDQNQEVMALYKKYGVNPMGSCIPMLLQIPFFFAFYQVLKVSVEMRGATWLWVTDLSQPEHLAIRILPVVMIVSQFVMQKMTPQPSGDPNQQKMMMFMPLIFGFMFYQFPSGLVLYYLTSNLVSVGQQWFFNHTETAQEAARSVEPPKKKNGRK